MPFAEIWSYLEPFEAIWNNFEPFQAILGGSGYSSGTTNMILEVQSSHKYVIPWGSEWSISHTPLKKNTLPPPPLGGVRGVGDMSNRYHYYSLIRRFRICKNIGDKKYVVYVEACFALCHRLISQEQQQQQKAKRVPDGHGQSYESWPWQK